MLEHFHGDPGLLTGDLDDVRTRIDELQRVTADFYGALAVESDVTDDDVFGRNRDRVLEALAAVSAGVRWALRRVGDALAELRKVGHGPVVETAAVHAGLVDPAEQQRWVDERMRRLADLEAWLRLDRDGLPVDRFGYWCCTHALDRDRPAVRGQEAGRGSGG